VPRSMRRAAATRAAPASHELRRTDPAGQRGRERMSSIDTAWLRMDTPSNLMMIVGVHLFDTPLDEKRFKGTIENKLLRYRRFRSRVVRDLTGAWWEIDPAFELDAHFEHLELPGNADKVELQALVAELASQPLDPTRPLWQMHLVENYHGVSGERQALIVRIHHCIADGIALIGVLLSMAEADARGTPVRDHPVTAESGPVEGATRWEALLRPATAAVVRAIDWSASAAGGVARRAADALQVPERAADAARLALRFARDAVDITFMKSDSKTRFKGKPGIAKSVAWTEPLPLDEVKCISRALGCSINDVLLASVAGALRAYLVEHGDAVDGFELRAMVPVNLRPAGNAHQLGNRFGLVPLLLPVGIENPLLRLAEVRRRMATLKTSFQPLLAMGLLGVVGFAPQFVQNQTLNLFSSKATAVMTNVPGPSEALYMAGARMSQAMFWVPQSGSIGMGVSILTYGGGVQFGLITDAKLVASPQRVIERFASQFEQLVLAVLMSDWRDEPAAASSERRSRRAPAPRG